MNIYVGNLSYKLAEENLKQLFEEFGEVTSAKIVTDNYSGRSKGFGFVEMPNDAEAQAAITKLHDADFFERKLIVNEARPKTERTGGGDRGGYKKSNSYGNKGGGSGYGSKGGFNRRNNY